MMPSHCTILGTANVTLTSGNGTIALANIGTDTVDVGNLTYQLPQPSLLLVVGIWVISQATSLTTPGALTIDAGTVDFGKHSMGGHLNITSTSTIDAGNITGKDYNVTLASGSNGNITVGTLGYYR